MHTYIHDTTCVHTCMHAWSRNVEVVTHQFTIIRTHIHTCMHSLETHQKQHMILHACIHTYMHTCNTTKSWRKVDTPPKKKPRQCIYAQTFLFSRNYDESIQAWFKCKWSFSPLPQAGGPRWYGSSRRCQTCCCVNVVTMKNGISRHGKKAWMRIARGKITCLSWTRSLCWEWHRCGVSTASLPTNKYACLFQGLFWSEVLNLRSHFHLHSVFVTRA